MKTRKNMKVMGIFALLLTVLLVSKPLAAGATATTAPESSKENSKPSTKQEDTKEEKKGRSEEVEDDRAM